MKLRLLSSLVLLVVLMAVESQARKKEKGKKSNLGCKEWQWGACKPNSEDCGVGNREGTCKEKEETKRVKCKVPCNWKKQFGGEKGALQPHPYPCLFQGPSQHLPFLPCLQSSSPYTNSLIPAHSLGCKPLIVQCFGMSSRGGRLCVNATRCCCWLIRYFKPVHDFWMGESV
uniref:Midkine n=1 Tax=Callorhinchus milii TaxID=7868 RepID=A0A4W3HSH6_CALMI